MTRHVTPPHISKQLLSLQEAATPGSASSVSGHFLMQALDGALGLVELSADGAILYANHNYLAFSGYEKEELIGQNHKLLCTGESILSNDYQAFWEGLRSGAVSSGVFHRQRKNGTPFWIAATYHRIFSPDRTLEKLVKFCTDITGHLNTLHEKEVRLGAIESNLITATLTPEGTFLSINENFLASLGYREEDVLQKSPLSAGMLSLVGEIPSTELWAHICSGHSASGLVRWTAVNGTSVWLDTVFIPVFNKGGQILEVVVLAYEAAQRDSSQHDRKRERDASAMAIRITDQAIIISDSLNKILFANPGFTRMFGYSAPELTGKAGTFILGPGEQAYLARARERFAERQPIHTVQMCYGKNGQRLWVVVTANPVFDEAGMLECVISTITDITEVKLFEILQSRALEGMTYDVPLERLLALVCKEIELITPGLRVVILSFDETGNSRVIATLHNTLKNISRLGKYVGKNDYPASKAFHQKSTIVEKDLASTDYPWVVRAFFKNQKINATLSEPILTPEGRVVGTVSFYQKSLTEGDGTVKKIAKVMARICAVIMEREENRATMRSLALYDAVTGLPNKELLIASAENFIATNGVSEPRCTLAVMCLSVDRFSRISQVSNFTEGDKILKIIAERLTRATGGKALLGRMFNDEFVLIFPNCNEKNVLETARRLKDEVSKPCMLGELELDISVSIGISLYPENGDDIESLIAHADTCLSQNKWRGKGTINFFSKSLNLKAHENLSLESRLRKAIHRGTLQLFFQPQVYMASGVVHGVEVLSRWHDTAYGTVPPDKFIPLAEESGLIDSLSDWVLRTSCRQLGEWRKKGLNVPSLSINLSAPNFRDGGLPERMLHYLGINGLTPKDLIVELTEGVLLTGDPLIMQTIDRVHALGFALSLDDFGTGYSSLSYLRQLPFSEIKLDKSFVQDLHTAETSRHLCRAVVLIGAGLNMSVLAEGVETKEQYQYLKGLQCSAAQGYLLSKPLPAPELEAWLADWYPHAMDDQYRLM